MTRSIGQHHGDLRRALLDAALELVSEVAPAALTLRGVARRAGVSPGACYHHFPDKDALLAAVAYEGFAALAAVQALQVGPDPELRLEQLTAAYVGFALAHPTHYQVMFRVSPGEVIGAGAEVLEEAARGTFETLVAAVAAAAPDVEASERMQRALLVWAQAHGAVEVARWARGLDPGFDAADFAARAGRAAAGIARGVTPRGDLPRSSA